jgi:hypothetical protein
MPDAQEIKVFGVDPKDLEDLEPSISFWEK